MYIRQEKAVTEQGVNPDQGSNGQDEKITTRRNYYTVGGNVNWYNDYGE